MIRLCCVGLGPLACPWLTLEAAPSSDVAIYRSTLHDEAIG